MKEFHGIDNMHRLAGFKRVFAVNVPEQLEVKFLGFKADRDGLADISVTVPYTALYVLPGEIRQLVEKWSKASQEFSSSLTKIAHVAQQAKPTS